MIKKIIQKAVDFGYELEYLPIKDGQIVWCGDRKDHRNEACVWVEGVQPPFDGELLWGDFYGAYRRDFSTIFFDIKFLKAFFGEDFICPVCYQREGDNHSVWCSVSPKKVGHTGYHIWEHYTKILIVKEDRVNFLGEFI